MPLPNRLPRPAQLLPRPAADPPDQAGADAAPGTLRYQIRQPDGSYLALGHGPNAEWTDIPGQAARQDMRAALPRPGDARERTDAMQRRRLGHAFQAISIALGGVCSGLLYQSNQLNPARRPQELPVSRKQVLQVGVATIAAGLAAKSMIIGDNLVAGANRILDATPPNRDPAPPAPHGPLGPAQDEFPGR